jgi:NAD(P)-dependent dehydrogenase (short-subunit alcohol dehydrogenase family)
VFGGTNGIGRALAHALAAKGAEVLDSGRTFRDQDFPRLRFIQAGMSSMKTAKKFHNNCPLKRSA